MATQKDRKLVSKVSKGAKIRNQYNQVPHLTQDTNGKVTNSQLYTTNEVSANYHLISVRFRLDFYCVPGTQGTNKS